MGAILIRSKDRGLTKGGWLESRHSFSFGNYYHPKRMGFGALKVLNEDWIKPDSGFPFHYHENFEIITIVLEGSLQHEDTQGNKEVINTNEVQRMSAGSGIRHAEVNISKTEQVHLFQIWIEPTKKNVKPSYEQGSFFLKKNELVRIISKDTIPINQDAELSLLEVEKGKELEYQLKNPSRGLWVQLAKGTIEIENKLLKEGDALAVVEEESVVLKAKEESKVLFLEVPLK